KGRWRDQHGSDAQRWGRGRGPPAGQVQGLTADRRRPEGGPGGHPGRGGIKLLANSASSFRDLHREVEPYISRAIPHADLAVAPTTRDTPSGGPNRAHTSADA